MGELIKYLMELLNIKSDSVLVLADMEQDLKNIKDLIAYRNYIRENLENVDTQYKTGFQKFVILTAKYKEIEFKKFNQDRLSNSVTKAFELSEKVRLIAPMILKAERNHQEIEFENLKKINSSEGFFSKFEIKYLKDIGTALECVRLQRSMSGFDPLEEKLEGVFEKLIELNPKRTKDKSLKMQHSSAEHGQIKEMYPLAV